MKKVNIILPLLLCSLLFASCSLEDKNKYPTIEMAFGVVENPNRLEKYYLNMDDGRKLYTQEVGETDPNQPNPGNGQRAFASFEVLTGSNIKIMSLYYPSIDTITKEPEDSLRYDAYGLDMLYPGGPDYLNIVLSCYYTPGADYKHNVLLIKKEESNGNEAHFDLVYSNGGDPGKNYSMLPFCFDLSPLKDEYADSIKLVINAYEKGMDNPKPYTFKYKWKNNEAN